jgi:hypothetical protein
LDSGQETIAHLPRFDAVLRSLIALPHLLKPSIKYINDINRARYANPSGAAAGTGRYELEPTLFRDLQNSAHIPIEADFKHHVNRTGKQGEPI